MNDLPRFLYHVGPIELRTLTPSPRGRKGFVDAGTWADELYGTHRPVFLSFVPGRYRTRRGFREHTIDADELEVSRFVVDIPSLVDAGMYIQPSTRGEIMGYWEEANEPAELSDILKKEGEIVLRNFMSRWQEASKVTQTVGYWGDISLRTRRAAESKGA